MRDDRSRSGMVKVDWSAVVRGSPDAVFVLDLDATIRSVNPAATELTGLGSGELEGLPVDAIFRGDGAAFVDVELPVLRGGVSIQGEREIGRKSGEIVPVLLSAAAIRGDSADGDLEGIVCTAIDITDRRASEEEVRRSQANLLATINNAQSGIWSVDRSGRLISMNRVFHEACRKWMSKEVGPGVDLVALFAGKARVQAEGYLTRALVGEAFRDELRLEVDGKTLDLSFAFNPISSPSGDEVVGVSVIATDVTEQRAAADALRAARDAAESATRAKSAFLATMGHEIRTPLNGIIGLADILADTELGYEQRDYVETIRSSSDLLLSVLNDVLDLSRLEAGGIVLEERPILLADPIEQVVGAFSAEAARKGLELVCDLEAALRETVVIGDSVRVRQIAANLVSNAIKFTEAGEVVIRGQLEEVEQTEFALRLEVDDTGIGIDAERADVLFEPFMQADPSTTRRFGGSGLGLAIVRRLVELMGGRVSAGARSAGGTSFGVTIPFLRGPDRIGQTADPVVPLRDHHILLADSHEATRRALCGLLESAGATVHVAATAHEALRRLRERPGLSALVLDARIGLWSGRSAETGREMAEGGPIPVLLLYRLGDTAPPMREPFVALGRPFRPSRVLEGLLELIGDVPRRERDRMERATSGRSLRVAIAEDNPVNRKVALKLLAHLGIDAAVATNGSEAVDLVLSADYDVVFLDIEMPEMDGMEAAGAIREKVGVGPYLVAMTAHTGDDVRDACLKAGMDDYVGKPVRLKDLEAALDRARTASDRQGGGA